MSTMREDIDASIDALDVGDDLAETQQVVETADVGETGDVPGVSGEEAVAESDGPTSSNDHSESAEGDVPAISAESGAEADSDPSQDSQDDKPTADSLKAPVDWSPKERESWSKVPRNLQERIVAREKDMATAMADTKDARQLQEHFGQMAQSFAPVMAAEGYQHPLEAVQAAFGAMAALRMGTPQQKAQEVARLVSQYGVDIQALDDALVGSPSGAPAADPQATQLEQMLEQKLAPMQQFMQSVGQQQQAQEQQGKQQAVDTVKKFGEQAEFLNDVREDMADIIELSAKRGVNLTLQQAYDRAVQAHPEISSVLQKREQDARIKGDANSLAAKQKAAVSITGRQTGTGGANANLSLRDQIAAAFDDASQ